MRDPVAVATLEHERLAALFGAPVERRIDTHAASVFLTRESAWKAKRPVRLDYLDFSTPALRRAALEAELALNQPLAPDLYRRVHAVTRDADGALRLDGTGPAIDWVLEMRRFADGALLVEMAGQGRLEPSMLVRLVDRIVDFHACAPPCHDMPGARRLLEVIAGNVRSAARFPELLPADLVARLDRRLRETAAALAPLLDARAREGRVRHGHGDLHLSNIALVDGEPTPFDRLEFSPALATGDLLYDLAFLVMDLWQSGAQPEANLVFNRYLDRSPADETGAPLMPLFMSVRAFVRAHTTALRARQGGQAAEAAAARVYLELALSFLCPVPPRLVAVGGASGTGKSAFARAVAHRLGHAPGARILRTDVLRKRAAGVLPETRLAGPSYSAHATAQVYAALRTAAREALAGGVAVIADATFLDPREQAAMEAVAAGLGVRFDGVWLSAVEDVRVARVSARAADASDADAAVARAQTPIAAPPPGWHRLCAEGPLEEVAAAGLAALEGPPRR